MKKLNIIIAAIMILNIVSGFSFTVFAEDFSYDFISSSGNLTVSHGTTKDNYGLKLVSYDESDEAKVTSTSYVRFDVPSAANGSYAVDVSYLKYQNGMFSVTYTDISGKKRIAGTVFIEGNPSEDTTLENIGSSYTATKSFVLENADFSGSVDFEINAVIDNEDSKHGFSKVPVYIKSVGVSASQYNHSVQPVIESKNIGNIFFDGDIPEFQVTYNEVCGAATSFTAEYKVYSINTDMSLSAQPIKTGTKSFDIAAGGSVTDTLVLNVENYGLYRLKLAITNDNGLKVERDIPFSKVVRNDSLNTSLGTNIHIDNWNMDEEYMKLAKNAGFGIVRDGISWNEYEEGTSKDYKFNSETAKLLKLTEKYGLEPLIILYSHNWHYGDRDGTTLAPDENLDDFCEFVTALLKDPLMEQVKKIEIENEPNAKAFYMNGTYMEKNHIAECTEQSTCAAEHGKVYAMVAEKVAQAADAAGRDDIQLGILSLARMEGEYSKVFSKSALDYLKDNNVISAFDALTIHPYSYKYLPETVMDKTKTNDYIALGEEYGIDAMWHTEFGWSTSKYIENQACIGDEYEQAKRIVRQYATVKMNRPDDILVQYDLVDDGVRTNAQEANYGLLCSEREDTPLSSKFSYPAVSNMNRMIGFADTYTTIKNTVDTNGTSGDVVCKFTSSSNLDKEVYMLWSLSGGTYGTFEGAEYYDLLGNRIEVQGDTLALTDEPIYAVCGATLQRAPMDITDRFEVDVNGEIATGEENVPVTVIITGEKTIDDYNDTDIIYMDQNLTGKDGEFSFRTDIISNARLLNVYVSAEGCVSQNFQITAKETDITMRLIKECSEIEAMNIGLTEHDDVYVIIDLKNEEFESTPTLIYGLYQDDILVYADTTEVKRTENSKAFEYQMNVPDGIEYNRAGVYCWDIMNLYPVCSDIRLSE